MKNITCFLFLIYTVLGFSQRNNTEKQIFKTNKKANVTINDTVNLDEFKEIALIPGGSIRRELEKINYFSKIMTEKEFKKEIKTAGLDPAKYNFDSQEGVERVFNNYKKFIYVFQSTKLEDKKTILLAVANPIGKKIFEVEGKEKTNVVGISAGTTYLPQDMNNAMLNELVEYIKRNSRTYKSQ